ncbi:SatD family protein [Mangrovimonas sp. AS39]|uniref:SatD family protein n=1 Tax=Mangrovimonas futianensis TaxID=2895523 RepID=UPI001E3FCAC5|nr:SatD family protein [Mangrovimonas futianensis]MCF1191939.1 SatD family protein [Mangrovimonas futianensis]MCF1195633.1 SatD family protein [Mangrovimonas futianensis]
MIGVITGDIVNSTKLQDPSIWLYPLRAALQQITLNEATWEVYRGDSFQLEIKNYFQCFEHAVYIKACIKSIKDLDVRLSIGIGEKSFEGQTVTESNGEAFQFSGETLETLKRDKLNLKIKTSDLELDQELNLYFKLISLTMDHWTPNSAEIVKLYLENKNKIQKELAEIIGISQDAVSKRMKRANLEEVLEIDQMYRKKISKLNS